MAICFMLALSSQDNPDVFLCLEELLMDDIHRLPGGSSNVATEASNGSARHACCTLWDGRLWKIKFDHLNSCHKAWIQSGKIQDNILLGKEMESEEYDTVLEWYSLKKYLEIKIIGE
ncbi:hypothetical protein VPH35_053631 [Triticum aestivum]